MRVLGSVVMGFRFQVLGSRLLGLPGSGISGCRANTYIILQA